MCVQHGGVADVVQLHGFGIVLHTAGGDTSALNHHTVTSCRGLNTAARNVSLQAGCVHGAHQGGHAFAVDRHITQGLGCCGAIGRLTQGCVEGHRACAGLDRHIDRSGGGVLHSAQHIHIAVMRVDARGLQQLHRVQG